MELVFIVVEVVCAHGEHHIDEVIHEDGEEGNAEDLDDGADYLFGDGAGVVVAVADCGECG